MNIKYILISIIGLLLLTVGVLVYQVSRVSNKPDNLSFDKARQNRNLSMDQTNGVGQGRDFGNGQPGSRGNCLSDECLAVSDLTYPVGDVADEVKTALNKALDDEYKAYSTYNAVIEKFGNVRPFIMILRAEEQHISSLKSLFDKYGLAIPSNGYDGKISSPATLIEACQAGVDAEIANASLYKDELLPAAKTYEDISLVFINLMNASQQKHLPAFQSCAQ